MHRYALVVIDMQRGFLDASSPLFIPGAADTVPACARAIDCCHGAEGLCPRRAHRPCPTRGRRNFTGRTRTMSS